MSWLARLAMVTAISITIAIFVSWISGKHFLVHDSIQVSSKMQETMILTDDNLVDHLSELTLKQHLHKVDWRHSILLLDLSVDPHHVTESEVFSDLQTICEFAFQQTANIQEVLVRVVVEKDFFAQQDRDTLLVSLDATRAGWERVKTAIGTVDAETRRLAMDVYFQVVYTEAWDEFIEVQGRTHPYHKN